MKKLSRKLFFVCLLALAGRAGYGQTTQQGAVQDQEFIIRKDRVLSLPKQVRNFEKLPALPQPKAMESLSFPVLPFFLALPASELRAVPAEKEWLVSTLSLFPGSVKVGYGSYLSPLVEARYMSTQANKLHYATRFNHQSFGKGPVQLYGEESKESHTELAGDVSYFLDRAEVFSSLRLRRDAYTYYGEDQDFVLPPNIDFIGPIMDPNTQLLGNFELGIRDVEKVGRLSYEGKLGFLAFKDSYAAKESQIGFQGKVTFRPFSEGRASLGVSYFTTTTADTGYSLNRNYLSLRPEVQYTWGDFQFVGGMVLVSENDSLAEKKAGIRLFPVLKSTYQIREGLQVHASLTGDVQRNTYLSFVQENPFLGPSAQLLNTIQQIKVTVGVAGVLSEKLHYTAGVDLSRQSNLHFFVNSFVDTSRFELVYDDQATVLQLNTALNFKVSDAYAFQTRLDVFHYSLSRQQAAWHRPTWVLSMNHQLTPFKKVRIQSNFNLMGGLIARGYEPLDIVAPPNSIPKKFDQVSLKPILDLQLKIDYALSSRLSIFAEGNNLLNTSNMRWLNYPVRGSQFLGGLSFKF